MKTRRLLPMLAGLLLAVSLAAAAEEAASEAPAATLPTPMRWTADKAALDLPALRPAGQPTYRFTVQMKNQSRAPRDSFNLLPRNFWTPATRHSRLRGPFEQTYPKLW